jgi:hypothetical protein
MRFVAKRHTAWENPTHNQTKAYEMLPNALASTGIHASTWSHLRSAVYALERAINPEVKQLSDLDKALLSRVAAEVRLWTKPELDRRPSRRENMLNVADQDILHSVLADGRAALRELREFSEWKRARRFGFEQKLLYLAESVERFLGTTRGSLFKEEGATEGLEVLCSLLKHMIASAEAAMGVSNQ